MNKFQNMDNHEINMAVTCIVHKCIGWDVSASNMSFYTCGIDGNGFYEVECMDYCGNISQAWPIIVDNYIEFEWISKNHCVAVHRVNDDKLITSGIFKREEALRAAMIVFLMMKEVSEGT